jgi:hypothetical protein
MLKANKTTNSSDEIEELGSSLLLAEDEASGPSLGFILGTVYAYAIKTTNLMEDMGSSLLSAEDEDSVRV